jgi:tRNA(Leu) C34 or U34 (ribose-2'-O)-methylase TrmL
MTQEIPDYPLPPLSKYPRGYFGIVAYQPKSSINVGTLWRTANIFGAAFIGTIGRRYKKQSSDTMKTPLHVPLFHFDDTEDFYSHLPTGCRLVAIERNNAARPLASFVHPHQAVYLLGPEDGSLPQRMIEKAMATLIIPGQFCLNVAVAGSIVLYDRLAKQGG